MHDFFVSYMKFHAFTMIKYTDQSSLKNRIFKTPFENELCPDNRWVLLEHLIPWDKMAVIFFARLDRYQGRGSIDLRIVMGAMFIQHSLNLTDRETILIIQENIYMQYFVGLSSFQLAPVFDHSLLSIFRKRLGKKGSKQLNEIFINHAIDRKLIKHRKSRSTANADQNNQDRDDQGNSQDSSQGLDEGKDQEVSIENRGTVKIDATVVPQNITYPTDTKLLCHARQISEQIIDALYKLDQSLWKLKPRTYRREARKKMLMFSKTRRPGKKKIKRQIKSELGYLRRNLGHIDEMMRVLLLHGIEIKLDSALRKKMYVISELYRQQRIMHRDNRKKISDRIVSISQPWVRPIVRGKAGSSVEFGTKINISVTEKMLTVNQSSFDAFNESTYLEDQIEAYKDRFGYYPEYALVDKIYLTRSNRTYLQEKGIRHTGSPLGRPPKNQKKVSAKIRKKGNERNHVEGKIGQGKMRYGLDKLRTKTKATSYCAINLIALVMNMIALQKRAFCSFFTAMNYVMKYHKVIYRPVTTNWANQKPFF